MRRVVVAMSGGVDSSVAAALLKKQGYEVLGINLRLFDENPQSIGTGRAPGGRTFPGCCGPEAVSSARGAALTIDIPFYTFDLRHEFRSLVIDHFVAEYTAGRTPNPCIRCNDLIKFGILREKARALDAALVATGHHARLRPDDRGNWHLLKGADPNKDQSYFLYTLTQEQMAGLLFPVGEYTKEQVRKIAAEYGLPNARRPESQELCFIPDNDYPEFLKKVRPEIFQPGPIYSTRGELLGEHPGIAHFTLGQRRGLRLALGARYYVVKIDPDRNAVIIGYEEEVYRRAVEAVNARWTSGMPPRGKVRVWAKVRYQGPGSRAEVEPLPGNRVRVVFEKPQWAPTPGQAVVFWQEEEVLGGATIETGEN